MPSLPYGPSPSAGWACGILAHSRTGPAVDWSARRKLLHRGWTFVAPGAETRLQRLLSDQLQLGNKLVCVCVY